MLEGEKRRKRRKGEMGEIGEKEKRRNGKWRSGEVKSKCKLLVNAAIY